MKAKLIFDLDDPEEKEKFEDAVQGSFYKTKLENVYTEIFRPAFKHGYSEPNINELLQRSEDVQKFVDLLADKFTAFMKDE